MSRYRVGVNAGPVHVSRRVGGGRTTKGLTGILVWFIVFPFECLGKLFGLAFKSRPKTLSPAAQAYCAQDAMYTTQIWQGPRFQNYPALPGWYTVYGQAWYWTGTRWTR